MLSDASIPVMEKAAQDPDRKVTFVDLIPGRLYNITLWTVSGANFSHSKKSLNDSNCTNAICTLDTIEEFFSNFRIKW